MPNQKAKIFSYEEANKLIPKVAKLTEKVIQELNTVRNGNAEEPPEDQPGESPLSDAVLKEVEEILQQWGERVQEMGAQPKGYFTVDFQSIDPELMYCWNYGEDRISFAHKVWENFSHRRPLAEGIQPAGNHMKWVN